MDRNGQAAVLSASASAPAKPFGPGERVNHPPYRLGQGRRGEFHVWLDVAKKEVEMGAVKGDFGSEGGEVTGDICSALYAPLVVICFIFCLWLFLFSLISN